MFMYFSAQKKIKRKYVTAQHLKQQHQQRKFVPVDKTTKMPTRKSPRLNKLQEISEASVVKGCASAKRKLLLHDPSHEDKDTGENQFEVIISIISATLMY